MALLIDRNSSVWQSVLIPGQLQGIVTQPCWDDMCHAVSSSETEGNLCACCFELVVCFTTGFFCIFCCHPCMSVGVADVRLNNKCHHLNRVHFENRRVLTSDSNGIQIHVNRIGAFENVVYTNQPEYVNTYPPGQYPPQQSCPPQGQNYPQGHQAMNPNPYRQDEPNYPPHIATVVARNQDPATNIPYAEATVIPEQVITVSSAPAPDQYNQLAKPSS